MHRHLSITVVLVPLMLLGHVNAQPAPMTVEEEVNSSLTDLFQRSCVSRTATIDFDARNVRFVQVIIQRSSTGQPCLDELEVFGPDTPRNHALASNGAVATASSALDHPLHTTAHLNDGRYGNAYSWIPLSEGLEWAQIELPALTTVSRVAISRDRTGVYQDRIPVAVEVRVSMDGQEWIPVASRSDCAAAMGHVDGKFPIAELAAANWDALITYAFQRERDSWSNLTEDDYLSPLRGNRPAKPDGKPYWGRIARLDALNRVLVQFEEMIERLAARGLGVERERRELARLRHLEPDTLAGLYLDARVAKRRLFFRDPMLAGLEHVLFAKHHPLKPSHNYSDHFDAQFAPGGGIYVLDLARDNEGRIDPGQSTTRLLFDGSSGIARHPVSEFDARTVYFAFRPDRPEVEGWQCYWNLWAVNADGGGLRRLTDGPFHDFDPTPLPDGGLAFMSTRCKLRFLCWRPQAYVLHRMEADGSGIRRLSHANLSEWNPSILGDGRILWTRSEYQDKGADFGHTLWAIRPDGTHPELVFGNNTPYCYNHAHEVPGTSEVVVTLFSHGDHQGPVALIDLRLDPSDTAAIVNITPDTPPQYQMDRAYNRTFRDPTPVSSDHFLVSHNPGSGDHWAIYLIDRYGNRELLYLDPRISSKRPSPLQPRYRPPVLASLVDPELAQQGLGRFAVQDIYEGLTPTVERGRVKYLRVVEEVPSTLEALPCGEFRADHEPFQDFYASPVHLVQGPPRQYSTRTRNALQPHAFRTGHATDNHDGSITVTEHQGWPSYAAKASLGTIQVPADGSVHFLAPAGRVLYFQALDGDYNEIQRMRSVVQLQPGEQRSCVGCHDNRRASPPPRPGSALIAAPALLNPPSWGAGPFDYERVVQPVLDHYCVRCHQGGSEGRIDLRGIRDPDRVPISYRSLIAGGWVHYFDWAWGSRHFKAEPLNFGTLRSPLFAALETEAHRDIAQEPGALRAIKEWIDLNCPLWPDYRYRLERPD